MKRSSLARATPVFAGQARSHKYSADFTGRYGAHRFQSCPTGAYAHQKLYLIPVMMLRGAPYMP